MWWDSKKWRWKSIGWLCSLDFSFHVFLWATMKLDTKMVVESQLLKEKFRKKFNNRNRKFLCSFCNALFYRKKNRGLQTVRSINSFSFRKHSNQHWSIIQIVPSRKLAVASFFFCKTGHRMVQQINKTKQKCFGYLIDCLPEKKTQSIELHFKYPLVYWTFSPLWNFQILVLKTFWNERVYLL